jgi:RND family efflux transporter MFP subunit
VLSVEHQVDLSTERDGVVTSIAKDAGTGVKAGEILGQLDDRTLQMELNKARNDLIVAENNVKFKEAELKAKAAALKRQHQLREYGLSSEADLEAAEFEAKGAEYDMHGWQALVESSHSEIHRLEIQLDQTRLRAPFSGVVVRRYVREGQAVAKNDKCFRISQLAPLQVQFQVPETSSKRPERGAPVDLSLIGDSGRALSARVVKVSPTVDPASDSYDVTAQLVGSGIADLRPGMAVHVIWPGTSQVKP